MEKEMPDDDTKEIPLEQSIPEELNPSRMKRLDIINTPDINQIMGQMINFSGDVLHEPTCVICAHPNREEIEQRWLQSKDYVDVKGFIRENYKITLPVAVIENHVLYHLTAAIREIKKKEYAEKIERVSSVNLTTLDRIGICLAALTERLLGINSIVPDKSTSEAEVEQIKTAETARLMASYNQLLKLQAGILGEMKTSGELITIPSRDFIEIFNDAIISAKDDGQRRAIKDILNRLTILSKKTQ
jgi:hypothetical protein